MIYYIFQIGLPLAILIALLLLAPKGERASYFLGGGMIALVLAFFIFMFSTTTVTKVNRTILTTDKYEMVKTRNKVFFISDWGEYETDRIKVYNAADDTSKFDVIYVEKFNRYGERIKNYLTVELENEN